MYGEALEAFAAEARDDLGVLLTAAAHSVMSEILARLADRGHAELSMARIAVFSGLEASGTNIRTLAERAGLTRQAMSALVREVEALGYVTTRPDPADGRAVLVELTAAGAGFCLDAAAVSHEVTAERGAALAAGELDTLRDWLRMLAAPPAAP
ncbi:MarR family winged helix-turn-helix transcriptional regulator [Agromyces bauzanensis]